MESHGKDASMLDSTDPMPAASPTLSRDTAERDATLTVKMRVRDQQGRQLGSVAAIHRDALTGRVTGITVRHGMFGHKSAGVLMADVLHIRQGSVVLSHSKATFGRLPRR
jgi:uncharacterized protein YrrD